MANLKQYSDIMEQLKKGVFQPLYLLHGEESYYIDKVSKYVEEHAIEEHERDFNLTIFYGRDLNKDQLLECVRKFPMMAQRQVVIVREAQDFDGKWGDLEDYFANPVASTVLVIAYKYKSPAATNKWVKAIENNGVVLYSKKHYDNELPDVINDFVRQMRYRIAPRAAQMMAEYLGNDLEKIEMELSKLTISVPLSKEITEDDVHRLIGVSKEYNVFEYINALSKRDELRSYRIAQHLGKNEKNYPFLLTVINLFTHFSRVMIFHSLKAKDPASAARELGVSPFIAKNTADTARHYDQRKTAQVISLLREFDARFKGVNSAYGEEPVDILKELTYKILM